MKSEDVHESEENAQNRMFVAGTSLRWTWLQEKIRASLKTTAKFGQNFVYERIGIGQGYMSLIERVHPNWTEADERLPQTFIVKIPSTEPSRRAVASAKERSNYFSGTDYDTFFVELERTVQHYHHTEISFYEMVKTNHLRLKIPKAYLLQRPDSENSQGVIIMEDIGEDSTVFATYDNLTPEDMYQIMDELAELHRFCMECTEWTTLRGLSLASSIRHHDQRQVMLAMFKAMQHLDEQTLTPLIDQIISTHWDNLCNNSQVFENLHRIVGLPPVLVHGDLRSTNVIWKRHNKRNTLAAIIDWQMAHSGCAVEDIARILICSLSSSDRRRHWRDVVAYYYNKLEEKIGRKLPFPLNKIERSFILIYPIALITTASSFGPGMREEIEANHPERRDELLEIMRDKALGIAEDVIHFVSMNPYLGDQTVMAKTLIVGQKSL